MRVLLTALLLALLGSTAVDAQAQYRNNQSSSGMPEVRFGVGVSTIYSSVDGIGLGLGARVSVPINTDLSIAGDLGFSGFVLDGRDEAVYVFQPMLSFILTLPQTQGSPYLIAGIGGYYPYGDNQNTSEDGPLFSFGLGQVQRLTETTLFYEVVPGLLVGPDQVEFVVPLRIGLIF